MALGRVFDNPLSMRGTPGDNGLIVLGGTYSLTTTDVTLVGSDPRELRLFTIPKGFMLVNLTGHITDVDGGTAFVWGLGDAGDVDRLIAGATAGQSAAFLSLSNTVAPTATTGIGYRWLADTPLDFQVTTAAGTPAAGTLRLFLHGTFA